MSSEPRCEIGTIDYDFHYDDHIDPPFSHAWVWGMNGMLVLCVLASVIHRARAYQFARQADDALDPHAPLTQGARFISGRVEFAEGQTTAISVHVEQNGEESKGKNEWSHTWTEVQRTTNAVPFYVRRPSGERVRVEPGENPILIDKPAEIVWANRYRRTRIAKLTGGEEVIVRGQLTQGPDPESQEGGGYRSSARGWVLAPGRGQRMEVCAEKLGDRHRKRARSFGSTIAALFWMIGFVNLFFLNYHARFFYGEDTCATVTNKNISISIDSKGRRTLHYEVRLAVDAPDKPNVLNELDDDDWERFEVGAILGFRNVPQFPSKSIVGTDTSTHVLTIIFASLFALLGFGVYMGTRNYRRWYEGKLNDQGKGRLPDPEISSTS